MKFVAVCGFGVGSSLILAMSLQKVADKLGLDVEVENTDLTSAHSTDCDVIFTSPQLRRNYRKVSPFLFWPLPLHGSG